MSELALIPKADIEVLHSACRIALESDTEVLESGTEVLESGTEVLESGTEVLEVPLNRSCWISLTAKTRFK